MSIDPVSIVGKIILNRAAKGEDVPSAAIPHAIDAVGNQNGLVDIEDGVIFVEEKVETAKGIFEFIGDIILGG